MFILCLVKVFCVYLLSKIVTHVKTNNHSTYFVYVTCVVLQKVFRKTRKQANGVFHLWKYYLQFIFLSWQTGYVRVLDEYQTVKVTPSHDILTVAVVFVFSIVTVTVTVTSLPVWNTLTGVITMPLPWTTTVRWWWGIGVVVVWWRVSVVIISRVGGVIVWKLKDTDTDCLILEWLLFDWKHTFLCRRDELSGLIL